MAFPNAVLGVLLGAATLTVTEGKNVDILVVTNSTFQDPFNVRVQLLSGSADGEGKGRGGKGREGWMRGMHLRTAVLVYIRLH